ncbi:MAG: hypothetical protein V7724_20090 [Sediminicola sp.]
MTKTTFVATVFSGFFDKMPFVATALCELQLHLSIAIQSIMKATQHLFFNADSSSNFVPMFGMDVLNKYRKYILW